MYWCLNVYDDQRRSMCVFKIYVSCETLSKEKKDFFSVKKKTILFFFSLAVAVDDHGDYVNKGE